MTTKQRFVEALKADTTAQIRLTEAITAALAEDYDTDDLVEWGVEAGFSESYVRATVSRVLIAKGQRRREKGAGRKVPNEARLLAEFAVSNFGDKAASMLRAACRLVESKNKKGAKE